MRLALWRSTPADVFVEDRYGWREREQKRLARENVWWRRHLRWIAKWPWPLRVVIVLFDVTILYTLFVAGLVLGLALRPLIF